MSWNALISRYNEEGQYYEAFSCLERMKSEGISPNGVTFICILKSCGGIRDIERGEEIHDDIKKRGMLKNEVVLGTALIDMYAKCGFVEKARDILRELPSRNEISFNILMAGYIQQGQCDEALSCFKWMQSEGISPSISTFICILKACAGTDSMDKGEQIHNEILDSILIERDPRLGTTLVDMYAKCGILSKAQEVLEQLPIQDVVSWNALIAGYSLQGQGYEALNCFESMQIKGISPNEVTFLGVLNACCHSGLSNKAEQILMHMIKKYMELSLTWSIILV